MPNAIPSPVLSLRVSVAERDLLRDAARAERTSVGDFVRQRALAAAELALMGRLEVTIPAADWEKFEAWARAPGRDVPALRALAAGTPAWRD